MTKSENGTEIPKIYEWIEILKLPKAETETKIEISNLEVASFLF